MIDTSKKSFQAWLAAKDPTYIVGYQGQQHSNPVGTWLRDQVKKYLEKEVGPVLRWGASVGIRPLGAEFGQNLGGGGVWYLDYHYTLPDGEYSGPIYIRIKMRVSDFGIPHQSYAVPMTAEDCLAVLART